MIATSMRTMSSMSKMLMSVEPKEDTTIQSEKVTDWIKDARRMLEAYIGLEEAKQQQQQQQKQQNKLS